MECGKEVGPMAFPPEHIFAPGDIISLKKPHPCGGREWEILRVGMDFRLRCLKCGHYIMLPRREINKRAKDLIKKAPSPELF